MFREMRRNEQLLPVEESISILEKVTSGVLAVVGDDEYPYSIPISYVYVDNVIYFHSALSGHKIDAIRNNNKASFCVIEQDVIIPEKYTTYFRSVIVFGKVRILEDESEKRRAIEKLAEKYSPTQVEGRKIEIESGFNHLCIIELTIEHLSGKEAIELVRSKISSIFVNKGTTNKI